MAIPSTSITKVIALAADDFKRTAFPDGSLPAPLLAPEFTITKTTTSITAVITDSNGATSYNVRVNSGTAVDGLTITGLTPGVTYAFQVQGETTSGTSAWSESVNVQTDAFSGGLTAPARRFTIERTFEGTVGVKTSLEDDGFDDVDGNSVYSDEQVASGTTSGKMTILVSDSESEGGSGGFGRWGGVVNLPSSLQEGDELFLKLSLYYPAGFNHYTTGGGGHVKWLRFRNEDTSGANQGYDDIYWEANGQATTYKFIKEGVNQWTYFADVDDYPHVFDQWVTFNVHMILSSDPSQGRMRVWVGPDLVLNSAQQTLNVSSHLVTDFYLFTYWNGDVPQNQSCYVDDLVLTSDRAETTLSGQGLPWLGV